LFKKKIIQTGLKIILGESIGHRVGQGSVSVQYGYQSLSLPVILVSGTRSNFMDSNWLKPIKLNWAQLCAVSMPKSPLQEALNRHQTVFCDELGE